MNATEWLLASTSASGPTRPQVFGTDVNGLPLSLDLSWLEQKAVIILLTLLHLGVKNVRQRCGGGWLWAYPEWDTRIA